jgi:hypothetical protein
VANVNAIYMSATANARVTGSFSLAVEMAKVVITAKLKVIEEGHH